MGTLTSDNLCDKMWQHKQGEEKFNIEKNKQLLKNPNLKKSSPHVIRQAIKLQIQTLIFRFQND